MILFSNWCIPFITVLWGLKLVQIQWSLNHILTLHKNCLSLAILSESKEDKKFGNMQELAFKK